MANWNRFDSLGELFGDHYGAYKDCMRNIEDLKALKERFRHDMYLINTSEVSRELRDITDSYQKLADNLDTKNYSWNGNDMRQCWKWVLEMRDDLKRTRSLKKKACESVMAAIDQDCRKWGEAALRELGYFNIFDKVTGTVDVALQSARDQLERIVHSM